tara:strand:- start:13390 stop:17436 length:4047 start_codon:yes stop_codon:yes gene_type:complete
MKKSIIYALALVFIVGFLIIANKKSLKVQTQHTEILKNHSLQKTTQLSKKERLEKGLPPNTYFEEKYLLEINPHTGRTHPENIYKVQQELKQQRLLQRRTPGDAIDNQWIERGPNNVGGRTRMVMYDPNDATHKRVFAGGVSGGLWVNDDITDVNSPWTQVGIDDNLSVTCMAVDPNNSQIMYIGTGELYNPQQALGNGIWKSTDGGATWVNVYQLRGTTSVTSSIIVPGTYFMTDIIVRDKDGNPATTNDSEVFASIGGAFYSSNPKNTFVGLNDYGIFKSTDDGANWSQLTLDVDGNPVAANKFEIGLDNTLWMSTTRNIYQKGGGRIYSSTDGINFNLKHTITNGRRTEIATSKTNANTLYVLGEVYTENVSGDEVAPFVSILKTSDAFATAPTTLSLPNDATGGIPADDFTRSQAWYNLVIEVDPTNDAIAYVGGINLFRTTDSGVSWHQISKNSPTGSLPGITVSYVHSDQHSWAFHPTDANIAVIGGDGGVFYANSLSAAATSDSAIIEHTKDYNTTQFYNAAISQTTDPEYIIGGTQDNGNLFFDEATSGINSATKVNRGDGTQCFIDKDGGYMIISNLYNNIYRYDLPYSGVGVTISSDSNTGNFVNAMVLDDNLDVLYTNGGDHLARFTDITTLSPTRTNITDPLITNISAIKVSPFTTTSSKVFIGTRTGKVIKIENANTASPTITDISSGSFLGNISSIEFGTNENEIMVTFYNFGVQNIWFTDDGGTTWENKEGDFPDINVRCILMNPLNTDEVIIGTELGVWNTTNFRDNAPKWNQSYNGMSNVAVTSLNLRIADYTVLASTYGRGMYTGIFKGNDLTTWTGSIDTDWTNVGNWSNGLPATNIDVKIPETDNQPQINTTVTLANLSIETNAVLSLISLGALTIEEDLINQGSLTINSSISNSGSLIVQGASTGNITYNRFVSADWHLISPPVTVQDYNDDWVAANSIASGTVNTNLRGIATYSNNLGTWEYLLAGESKTFNEGKGYSTLRTSSGNLAFTGTPLTTATTENISAGTSNAFNLIGNVYASYIPLNNSANATYDFLDNNVNALSELTIWLWNGSSYATVNHASSSQFIAPGQAFFVSSKPEGGSVSFATAMQHHQNSTFFKTKQSRPEIRVFLSKGKTKKYTDIFYIENTTEGFDNGYDSSLYTGVSSNFEIYTKLVNQEKDMNLAIQSIPENYDIVIPVGITIAANEEVELSIDAKNIDKDNNVYLEDKATGVFTLMNSDESVYTFTSEIPINGSGRFFIHTSSETLQTNEVFLSNITIFTSDDKLQFVNLPQGKKSVKMYSLLGKLILDDNLENKDFISTKNISKALYIVRLETEKGTINQKIILE